MRASAADAFTEILLNNVAAARSSSLPGPVVSLATRETLPTKLPDVYSGHYRSIDFPGRGNLLRIPWEAASTVKAGLAPEVVSVTAPAVRGPPQFRAAGAPAEAR